MSTTAIPTPAQLRAAPELAALAILDAALITAEEALLAHRPDIGDLDGFTVSERRPTAPSSRSSSPTSTSCTMCSDATTSPSWQPSSRRTTTSRFKPPSRARSPFSAQPTDGRA
jgi:hypothetical protein